MVTNNVGFSSVFLLKHKRVKYLVYLLVTCGLHMGVCDHVKDQPHQGGRRRLRARDEQVPDEETHVDI